MTTKTVQVLIGRRGKRYAASPSTWLQVLRPLVELGKETTRNVIARILSDDYPGLNPEGDDNSKLIISLSDKHAEALKEVLQTEGIEMIEIVEEEGTEQAASKPRSRVSGAKPGKPCACGCGNMTKGGTWVPGHDATYKSALIQRVDRNGDPDAAAELVDRNWWSEATADSRLAAYEAKVNDTPDASDEDEDDED